MCMSIVIIIYYSRIAIFLASAVMVFFLLRTLNTIIAITVITTNLKVKTD